MPKSVNRLKVLRKDDKVTFLSDQDKIGSTKYNLIVSIESAVDICKHIISQNGYRTPEGDIQSHVNFIEELFGIAA